MKPMPTRRCFLIAVLFFLTAIPVSAIDDYTLGPDSQIQEGVPRGEVTQGVGETARPAYQSQ